MADTNSADQLASLSLSDSDNYFDKIRKKNIAADGEKLLECFRKYDKNR